MQPPLLYQNKTVRTCGKIELQSTWIQKCLTIDHSCFVLAVYLTASVLPVNPVNLINNGVTINGHSATVEFSGMGPSSTFLCSLDFATLSPCEYVGRM